MITTFRWQALAMAWLILPGCLNLNLHGANRETAGLAERADQGSADAQYALGLRYTNAVGVDQDFNAGLKAFRKAAVQGHSGAQYLLGMGYFTGRGTDRDELQARAWLTRAADGGHAGAQYQLGLIYLNGQDVIAEPAWSLHWIGRAAEQDLPAAQYALGIAYLKGLGTESDPVAGLQWLLLADKNGYPPAAEMMPTLIKQRPEAIARARRNARHWQPASADRKAFNYRTRFVQYRLKERGYDVGKVDGYWGPRTRTAVRQFGNTLGLKLNSVDDQLIQRLRQAKP